MKDDKLFRSIALERLSSPENLDQVMRVVPAKNWFAFICLFVFLATACVWAFAGEITRQTECRGVLVTDSGGAVREALAVMESKAESEPRPGMRAEVLLDSGETLYGTLVSVEGAANLAKDSVDLALAKTVVPAWTADEQTRIVRVRLDEASTQIGASNAPCSVRVILERFHPIRLMLPE